MDLGMDLSTDLGMDLGMDLNIMVFHRSLSDLLQYMIKQGNLVGQVYHLSKGKIMIVCNNVPTLNE